ncbi:MAG TPA: hypothetical protein VGR37_21120 [Longimicrobiaceae bacterium]|nr:hypothetical protein [Longimicrobiaceae bacterium]
MTQKAEQFFDLEDPRVWVECITFSDGTSITLGPDDVVVFVGPNSAGKSATLRFIREHLRQGDKITSPVVSSLAIERKVSADAVPHWLASIGKPDRDNPGLMYGMGVHFRPEFAAQWLTDPSSPLREVTRLICHMLTSEERLKTADPAGVIDMTGQAPSHPIHYLYRNEELEQQVSLRFREAFGRDLVVHRAAGATIPIYCGQRPAFEAGEHPVHRAWIERLEQQPLLHEEGDGMRSFAGVLLNTMVGPETIILLDEPEVYSDGVPLTVAPAGE